MNDEHDPLLMEHEADGIRELDNKLPRWWVWLFYCTTVFAVAYMLYYHLFHAGDLMAGQYDKEMKVGTALKQAAMTKFESELVTLQPAKDQAIVSRGHDTFLRLCAPCHRADAGGLVGPNLTDDYWIHGDKFADNLRTIWNGVPEKGMITWKTVLKPKEVYEVASYIYTLRGTHPANPKPPENQAPPVKKGPSEFE
jgi:cytochrome c oxidase cbb3-type subunit III